MENQKPIDAVEIKAQELFDMATSRVRSNASFVSALVSKYVNGGPDTDFDDRTVMFKEGGNDYTVCILKNDDVQMILLTAKSLIGGSTETVEVLLNGNEAYYVHRSVDKNALNINTYQVMNDPEAAARVKSFLLKI